MNSLEKHVTILGSTGSIGTQTLQVCRHLGFHVDALTAHRNTILLEQQAREFLPQRVTIADDSLYSDLKTRLADTSIQVSAGLEEVCACAQLPQTQVVCNSVVGMVGLGPTLAAITQQLLDQTRARLSALGISLQVEEDAVELLAQAGRSQDYGARPLRRAISSQVEDPAADLILEGHLNRGDTLYVSQEAGILQVRSVPALSPPQQEVI